MPVMRSAHWFLIRINFRTRHFTILDPKRSHGASGTDDLYPHLMQLLRYLDDVYDDSDDAFDPDTWNIVYGPGGARQTNSHDCGAFVLTDVLMILQHQHGTQQITQLQLPVFRRMFYRWLSEAPPYIPRTRPQIPEPLRYPIVPPPQHEPIVYDD